MDSVVHTALEEICRKGPNGLLLPDLWPKLSSALASGGLPLCANVKQVVWESLLEIPGLGLEAMDRASVPKEDLIKCTVEESEKLSVKIVAPEATRKSFLGICELEASDYKLSNTQRIILEHLAVARENGISQNELSTTLSIPSKNLFYQLKKLEIQGLIVRHPAVIWAKQAPVNTNMLYLYQYRKHLGPQQRLEITMKDNRLVDMKVANEDNLDGESKEDVHVKDFLPKIEAICEKLENAEGKVLVISDLKRDLGYWGRDFDWRNICHRLKDAQVIEECCAVDDDKKMSCFRLLRSFSPSLFGLKSQGHGNDKIDMDQMGNLVKRGQITEQLLELPILHQIYDMIDAAGSKGLTNTEVCRRLGLCSKEYHKRYFKQLISRFGLHLRLETLNRVEVYRVWTSENFNPDPCDVVQAGRETITPKSLSSSRVLALEVPEKLPHPLQIGDTSSSLVKVGSINESENDAAVADSCIMTLECINQENSDTRLVNEVPVGELLRVSGSAPDNTPAETRLATGATLPVRRSYPNYPRLTMGSINREQRILAMLQEEKFLIKPELHRRLMNLEEKKNTMMDRKTLERSLKKLQQEGRCKCILVSVPAVTTCGRSRATEVVLHPSVYSVSDDLLYQIHDRMRSFEIQVRRQLYTGQNKDQRVHVLNKVQRIPSSVVLNRQSEHAEMMRSNGFVFAKMVRTKLLHIFLWGWVHSSSRWDYDSSFCDHACDLESPHSFYKLVQLDNAIRSMPLELFLQVVGSAKKIENMVEKCRRGLILSDLPIQEYKCLMDTRATSRLSWLISILRRLKLIRLVNKGHAENGGNSQMNLTDALELKPYIEEPVSTVSPSGSALPDLRPRVRHDFFLSSRKAVNEYWNTLEYCYAAAKSPAALLAFPGSAVPEVFHSRSWASVRVMTASQRAELLSCLNSYDAQKKLSFRECEKIAKDLNLTMEQVLRVHYDKRQQLQPAEGKRVLSSRKRKPVSSNVSSDAAKDDADDGQPSMKLADQLPKEKHLLLMTSEEYDCQLQQEFTGNKIARMEELELNEDREDARKFIYKRALSRLGSARQKKFSWTEAADRQLVMEYVKHQASLGAKSCVKWASVSNLPAPPSACKRRMAQLKSYIPVRKAVMKLCDMLAERHAKYLEKFHGENVNHRESGKMVRCHVSEGNSICASAPASWKWDDFDENDIKVALEDILRCKRMAKLQTVQDNVSTELSYEEGEVTLTERKKLYSDVCIPSLSDPDFEGSGDTRAHGQRSRSCQLPRKYVKILSNVDIVKRQVDESVAIANAVELFKLIFLSTSKAPEVQPLLAETLRRYSEHDLIAAFNYLREKKIMIGGSCNSPFVLSQHFLQFINEPEFPKGTGERAGKFLGWFHEKEKYLMEEGIDVPSDWQCGEVFILLSLISSGELSITPCLPDEGVGESEDYLSSRYQGDDTEFESGEISKRLNTFDGDGRRGKGFPGMKVILHREKVPKISVEPFRDSGIPLATNFGGKDERNTLSNLNVSCASSCSDETDHVREILDSGGIHRQIAVSDSPWEAMANYAEYLMSSDSYQVKCLSLDPSLFKTLYSAIQKSGDQGLSLREIQKVLNIDDEKTVDIMVDVLETFGQASKVNAYDCIHVVDSLYRSKYFLSSSCNHPIAQLNGRKRKFVDEHRVLNPNIKNSASINEIYANVDEVHRVTILNLPEDVLDTLPTICKDKTSEHQQSESVPPITRGGPEDFMLHYTDTDIYNCILPWTNGDGSINEHVYKGLIRRVLGIVMKNPGITEDELIKRMDCLNPQSCRKLIEIMSMDNHIFTRKLQQRISTHPPAILGNLLGIHSQKSKLICRVHFFANPMSTTLL